MDSIHNVDEDTFKAITEVLQERRDITERHEKERKASFKRQDCLEHKVRLREIHAQELRTVNEKLDKLMTIKES